MTKKKKTSSKKASKEEAPQEEAGSDGNKRKMGIRRKLKNGWKKMVDDNKLKQSIEADGARMVVEMAADGNCLFRSLSDQLYHDRGNLHAQVREEVCDYLEAFEEDFCVFLVLDENEQDEDAANFEQYIVKMRSDGEWAGNLELVAASRLYR
jgi:OTU domain-containing protein 3